MSGVHWVVTDDPDPYALAELEQNLADAARQATAAPVEVELAVLHRDADGSLRGGAYGTVWGGICDVHGLWVRADLRGQGLGSDLIRRIESAAAERGCTQVLLLAYDVLVAGFFERLGYAVVGVVDEGPGGRPVRWFHKPLPAA